MQEDIKKALKVLREGGVILYPTDTIWGLGCDATNAEAVEKIYKIKQRSDNKSMIVLMDSANRLYPYIEEIPEIAIDVIDLSEKPLTVILEGAKILASNVINKEDNSVGVRIVDEPFCKQLIERFRLPIVSTSANVSGQPSPAIFDDISEEIKTAVDYIVEYRQDDLTRAQPSGIIKIGAGGEIKIIRE